MTNAPTSVVPVIQKKGNMSRLQRQFNSRIRKIKKLKTQIEEVEQAIPNIRSLIQRELQPLQDKMVDVREAIVRRLDQAWDMKFFRHKEKAKLQELITTHAFDLIQQHQRSELEAIYNKHTPTSYQEEAQVMNESGREMAASMFKNFFGMDLDLEDVDMNDWGQVTEKVFASMEEKAQQQEEQQQNKQDDFFGLLSLEIELMKGEAHELSALPDEQLKYYNKMLKDQVDELQGQLQAMMNPPPPFDTLAPYLRNLNRASWMVDQNKQQLQATLSSMEADLDYFSDKKNLRAFLRDYQLEDERPPEDDFFFFDPYGSE